FFDGTTKEVEDNQFQDEKLKVYIYYTPLPHAGLELDETETTKVFVHVSSMDTNQQNAKKSFDYATELISQGRSIELYDNQVDAWMKVWSSGRIEVDNVELQRQINSAYYYLLSSLPALNTKSDKKQFYGLSPGSLSRGGKLGEDYG
ncbi:unnamed protein product, partial [Didymodactylos carnosus]